MYKSWVSNTSYPGAIPPPAGVDVNLENPPGVRRTVVLVTLIVCAVISTLFFFTRAYVKLRITRKVLLEDGQ